MLGGVEATSSSTVRSSPIHTHELLPAGLPTSQRPTAPEVQHASSEPLGSPKVPRDHPTRGLWVVMGELTPAQAHRPFLLLAHLYPSGLSMTMDEQMNAICPSLEVKTWQSLKEDHTPHFSLHHPSSNRTEQKNHTSLSLVALLLSSLPPSSFCPRYWRLAKSLHCRKAGVPSSWPHTLPRMHPGRSGSPAPLDPVGFGTT